MNAQEFRLFRIALSFAGQAQKILQIGNAIPPVFAEIMAKQIKLCDSNLPGETIPSLKKFDVTKSSAMSPALKRTYAMLNELQAKEYEQTKWRDKYDSNPSTKNIL